MNKTACIITGGMLYEPFLAEYVDKHPQELLIVVDGALTVTHQSGIQPDYIVGDFDLATGGMVARKSSDVGNFDCRGMLLYNIYS